MFNCRNCFVFQSQADFMMLESLTVRAAHLFPLTPLTEYFSSLKQGEAGFLLCPFSRAEASMPQLTQQIFPLPLRWALPQPSCTQWCEFRVPGRGPHTSGNPCGISRESLTEKWRGTSRVLFLFYFLKKKFVETGATHCSHSSLSNSILGNIQEVNKWKILSDQS